LSSRQELIINALQRRHIEVCKSALQSTSNVSGEKDDFISHLRRQFLEGLDGRQFREWIPPETWFGCRVDSLSAIRVLAADDELECNAAEPPEELSFFRDLQASARDPQRRFALLTTRYLHPLNFVAPTEVKTREHLLERLMVADRSRIERNGLQLLNADDLLLRLNLIAMNASVTSDLRYLDALNYYYELLPPAWSSESPHNWLRVSFLIFYVRALAVRLAHIN